MAQKKIAAQTLATLCCLGLLGLLAQASTLTASPATHGRVRPLNRVYKTHQGWEYRTDHFITVATTGADDARWAGEELESAWRETARLADHFGDTHRRQDMGLVGALVSGTEKVPRTTGNRFPKLAPSVDPAVVQVELGSDADSKSTAQHELRKGSAATLLKQSGYLRLLPAWAAEGLTEFVAASTWNDQQYAAARASLLSANTDTPPSQLVFRYLMTADDGSRTATFLGNYGDDQAYRVRRRTPVHNRWDLVAAEQAAAREKTSALAALPGVSETELRARIGKWLSDPHTGEPQTITTVNDGPNAERAREMALLVKLWVRYGEQEPQSIAGPPPADREDHRDAAADKKIATKEPTPIDLAQLYRTLTSAQGPAWSTLDTDGRLLTWRDQDRIEALFAGRLNDYRGIVRDGRAVLQSKAQDGTQLEAWIEQDEQQARRPVIRVQDARRARF